MTTDKSTFTTPKGIAIEAHYRTGTNDKDCLSACIINDEYHLIKLIGEAGKDEPHSRKCCIDLGAHIGGPALILASLGWDVYAVEVLPENASLLKMNAIDNARLTGSITVVNRAIAAVSDIETVFSYSSDLESDSGRIHRFMGNTRDGCEKTKGQHGTVSSVSLNELLEPLESCPLIKTDCEGAEWPAFSSVLPAQLAKVKMITGELHNGSLDQFMAMLHGQFVDVTSRYKVPFGHMILERKEVALERKEVANA